MSLLYDISGKIAVVTGGAIGLGAAITEELLKESAKAVVVFNVLVDKTEDTVNRLNAEYGEDRVMFIKCDVTEEEQLSLAYKRVMKAHQRVDIVFNNAGIFNETKDKYKTMIATNFTGVVESTMKAMELMRSDCGGSGGVVVNISSISAVWEGSHLFPVYGATKAGILYYSNAMGVRVLVICPDATATTIMDGLIFKCVDEATGAQLESFKKAKSLQSPEEAARACVEVLRKEESASTWSVADGVAADISKVVRAGRISM